jgi:hypothetical protein
VLAAAVALRAGLWQEGCTSALREPASLPRSGEYGRFRCMGMAYG